MIIVYELKDCVWKSVSSGTHSNEHAIDLIVYAKDTMITTWGGGEDFEEDRARIGELEFEVSSKSEDCVHGHVQSKDGKRHAFVMCQRL